MNPETVNAIKDALAPIAAKIGQGAEYGWEIVVRQQYVTAVEGLAMGLLGLVFIIAGLWLAKKNWNTEKEVYGGGYDNFASYFIGAVALVIGGFLLLAGADQAITHFLNPAYYALDFFIHLGTPTQ